MHLHSRVLAMQSILSYMEQCLASPRHVGSHSLQALLKLWLLQGSALGLL